MSEDEKTYQVRSAEPLAQVEPEGDYYRRQMRRVQHAVGELDSAGMNGQAIERALITLRMVTSESLRRPRSNGEAVDRLERELAELRSDLIDYGILKRDYREAQERLNRLWREQGPLERIVRATIGEAAIRLDRWRK